jgi:hypothetical protein
MDCLIPNCKCSCHIKNPQEVNIKELMIQQLEKEAETKDLINQDYDDLWARRVRIHKGEEKPLSHDEYKTNFPKLSDIRQQLEAIDFDKNIQENKSIELQSGKKESPQKITKVNQQVESQPAKKDANNIDKKLPEQKSAKVNQQVESQSGKKELPEQKITKVNQQVESQSGKKELPEQKSCEQNNSPFPKPVPLNPLHKYKVAERDLILREVYLKALSITKMNYPKLDIKTKEFNEYVKIEADNQLDIWLRTNK